MTDLATDKTRAGARRRPGRPRDEELDGQIVAAALELIDAEQEVTVARVVARSGVSRAALYRRWPSLTTLVAAALDVGRRVPDAVAPGGDLRETLIALLAGESSITDFDRTEARFRQRIRLVMADRQLQRAYWISHVSRRREPIEAAIRDGIARGELRSDLDVEACFDAFAGAAYYQFVVRGDRFADPATRQRLRAAFDVTWRGMLAE